MADSVAAFIPTLDSARAAGVALPRTHSGTEKLAALMVSARAIDAKPSVPSELKGRPKRPRTLLEIYVPDVLKIAEGMFHFESTLEGWISTAGSDPPECLRCHDLKPRQSGGAYRKAQETRAPDFHGHLFGDTIDQAIDALESFFLGHRGKKFDIRAWAWPLLVIRQERFPQMVQTTVLLLNARGEHVTFVAGTGLDAQ